MQPVEAIRVELLKLAHRHDLAPEVIVGRAQKLEQYVVGQQAPAKPGTLKLPVKAKEDFKPGSQVDPFA